MEYAAIIAAISSVIGGLIGAGKDAEAKALREKMAAQFGPEILPQLDKAVAEQTGPSKFESIIPDARDHMTQDEVSSQLADIYNTGGQTAQDQGAYDVARRGVSQRASANAGNNAIEANRRGISQSGLGAALASQSGQDELEALAGLNAQIASSGRDRALQALQARGGLASSMRGQDWAEQSGKASAIDLMNRFNAGQRQSAQLYNLGIPQQQFTNNMNRLSMLNGVQNGQVTGLLNEGQQARDTAAGVANSALSYGQAYDWSQDPNNPKNKGGK